MIKQKNWETPCKFSIRSTKETGSYAEGVPSTIDTIAEFGKEIYMPVVVIAELTFGFMKGAKQEDNEKNFSKLSTNCNWYVLYFIKFVFFIFWLSGNSRG